MTGQPENPLAARWDPLPGDPPALRRWLAGRAGDDAPDDWPAEEPR